LTSYQQLATLLPWRLPVGTNAPWSAVSFIACTAACPSGALG
jgi:hypothetical protein